MKEFSIFSENWSTQTGEATHLKIRSKNDLVEEIVCVKHGSHKLFFIFIYILNITAFFKLVYHIYSSFDSHIIVMGFLVWNP